MFALKGGGGAMFVLNNVNCNWNKLVFANYMYTSFGCSERIA